MNWSSAGRVQAAVDKTVIGLVVDEISTDPWMALGFDGVREKAWEFGLTVNLAVTRGDRDMEDQVMGDAGAATDAWHHLWHDPDAAGQCRCRRLFDHPVGPAELL